MMERSVTILRWSAGLAISLAAVALIALSLTHAGYLKDTSSVVASSVERIASLLNARSPGSRTAAELTKQKEHSGRAEMPGAPEIQETERMLGKTFGPDDLEHVLRKPEELLAGGPMGEQVIELPPELGGPFELAETQFAVGMPTGGGIGGPGWIIGGSGGGGSSGGGSGGGDGVGGGGGRGPALPPSAIPAIPEPSTWATMILGVLLCAASMRRRNRRFRRALA